MLRSLCFYDMNLKSHAPTKNYQKKCKTIINETLSGLYIYYIFEMTNITRVLFLYLLLDRFPSFASFSYLCWEASVQ